MSELFTNNAATTLAGAITAVATSLTVATGDGAKFPSPAGADFFRLLLLKKSTGEIEIVKVTTRATDTFTIVRAQEGTTALALNASDLAELRPTAGFFGSLLSNADMQTGAYTSAADSGAANAYAITLSPAPTAYGAFQRFSFVAANACTGASTLNVNGLGAVAIKKYGSASALVANDIKAGSVVVVEHDGTVFQLISAASREPVFADVAQTFAGAITLLKSLYQKKGADIASANDMVLLGDGNYNDVTGSIQVNGFTDGVQNETRKFHFDDAVPLKHNTAPSVGFSKLWIPGGDYTTTANDEIEFTYDGIYWRATGSALAAGVALGAASSVPVGATIAWNTATPPAGYLEEDGSAVSRTTYAALFAVIGTTFGAGDGTTTFNLADKRGRFLRGWDHGAGTDPDAATRTDRGDGTTGNNVGTKQADQLKSHTHIYYGIIGGTNYTSGTEATIGALNTGSTGGNETRPTNINVMYCIKY